MPNGILGHSSINHAIHRAVSRHQQVMAPNRLQRVSSQSINKLVKEHIPLMRSPIAFNRLRNIGAPLLTPSQVSMAKAGFQRVVIGGDDNRCWVRAPWFGILHQHTNQGTLALLRDHIEHIVHTSGHPEVKTWKEANPKGVESAFQELMCPQGQRNHTLNKNGYFSPAVETMLYHASQAIFDKHKDQSTYQGDFAGDRLHCAQPGYQLFSDVLLQELGSNMAIHKETDAYSDHAITAQWLGSDQFSAKQDDCMIYHRSAQIGHFEVMLKDARFTPAEHHNRASHANPNAARYAVHNQGRAQAPQYFNNENHSMSQAAPQRSRVNTNALMKYSNTGAATLHQFGQLLALLFTARKIETRLKAIALVLFSPLLVSSSDRRRIFIDLSQDIQRYDQPKRRTQLLQAS